MEEQLVQAVQIASNPQAVQDPSLPVQALQFLEHLKTVTHESWNPGWHVFAARGEAGDGPRYDEQARMFGLNLVADFLENHVTESPDPAGSVAYLQEAALAFIQSEFVSGSGERGAGYVKNKLAQVLTMLLLRTYSLPEPATLLPTLVALFRTHAPSSSAAQASPAPLNPTATDLVLRVLHDLSVTLGSDVTLRAVRSRERLQRDAAIRDEIRANHAVGVAEAVWGVVEEGISKLRAGDDAHGWGPARAAEITEMAISVVGDYVSWIDISLMITPHTVSLFFALLRHDATNLRKAAADALLEVISKGMKPASKMELLQVIDLTSVIGTLESETRTNGSEGKDHIVELRERLARLTNGVTLELVKILDEGTAEESAKASADEQLLRHLFLVLAFLADEYDEPTECVLSGITATLSYYKKLKKKVAAASGSLPASQLDALARLVDVALQKMKYDDEAEWTGAGTGADRDSDRGFSDDEEAHFVELRKQLQHILASVASIEESLFSSKVQTLIVETLHAVGQGLNGTGPQLSWQQAEVAVFAAYFYVEVLINSISQPKMGVNVNTFVQLPPEASRTSKNRLAFSVYPTLPLNPVGETVQALVESNVSSFPHPAVQLQFFECLNRYASFFITRPDKISFALFAFLDTRGLYNGHTGVRHRIWYLFSRFVKEVAPVVPGEYVRKVLSQMKDVLVVNAELPAVTSDEDPLVKATDSAGSFDSQLYLFESAGCLIAVLKQAPQQQVPLLNAVCEPLMAQLQQAVQAFTNNDRDLRAVLQAHHLMLSLANLAQGFPDLGHAVLQPSDDGWIGVFKTVTEQVLIALTALNRFSIIREASRGAFTRIVATTGQAVLPFIPTLIQGLLGEITSAELVDFLSFLGLIVAKYKNNVQSILDELLLLLLERIFHFLNQDVSGTDDAVQRSELQRAYINLLAVVTNSGLDGLLLSERNQGQLQTMLQSIVYYASNGDPPCQRASFTILGRLVTLWGAKPGDAKAAANGANDAPTTDGTSTPVEVPGFEAFIYETLVPLTFEVPVKPDFDFGDAQAQMVLTEITTLLKTVHTKRPPGELASFLVEVYFPRLNCPQEIAQAFVQNLSAMDAKKFKAYFAGFIQSSRG